MIYMSQRWTGHVLPLFATRAGQPASHHLRVNAMRSLILVSLICLGQVGPAQQTSPPVFGHPNVGTPLPQSGTPPIFGQTSSPPVPQSETPPHPPGPGNFTHGNMKGGEEDLGTLPIYHIPVLDPFEAWLSDGVLFIPTWATSVGLHSKVFDTELVTIWCENPVETLEAHRRHLRSITLRTDAGGSTPPGVGTFPDTRSTRRCGGLRYAPSPVHRQPR